MSAGNKRNIDEEDILQISEKMQKMSFVEDEGQEENKDEVEERRDGVSESKELDDEKMEIDSTLATLSLLVVDAAVLHSLTKVDTTKVKMATQGRLLSLYRWSDDEMGLDDFGRLLLPLVRMESMGDVICSYALRYFSFFFSSYLFISFPSSSPSCSGCPSCSFAHSQSCPCSCSTLPPPHPPQPTPPPAPAPA